MGMIEKARQAVVEATAERDGLRAKRSEVAIAFGRLRAEDATGVPEWQVQVESTRKAVQALNDTLVKADEAIDSARRHVAEVQARRRQLAEAIARDEKQYAKWFPSIERLAEASRILDEVARELGGSIPTPVEQARRTIFAWARRVPNAQRDLEIKRKQLEEF